MPSLVLYVEYHHPSTFSLDLLDPVQLHTFSSDVPIANEINA
jgi:hypothetical protein